MFRERVNTYRFARDEVVDLLMRVTRVSVETLEIVEAIGPQGRLSGFRAGCGA
jgi:hypothetical protein